MRLGPLVRPRRFQFTRNEPDLGIQGAVDEGSVDHLLHGGSRRVRGGAHDDAVEEFGSDPREANAPSGEGQK